MKLVRRRSRCRVSGLGFDFGTLRGLASIPYPGGVVGDLGVFNLVTFVGGRVENVVDLVAVAPETRFFRAAVERPVRHG